MEAPYPSRSLEIVDAIVVLAIIKNCQSFLQSDGLKLEYHPCIEEITADDLYQKRNELLQPFFCPVSEETPVENTGIFEAHTSSVVDALEDCCQQLDRLKSKNINEQILSLAPPAGNQDISNSLRLDELEKKIFGLQEARHNVKKDISNLQVLLPTDQKVQLAVSSIVHNWFFEQKAKFSDVIPQDYVANNLRLFKEGIDPMLSTLQKIKEDRHIEIMTTLSTQINSCSPEQSSNPLPPVPQTSNPDVP